jgi:SPP1 gp7 family putative phage head morphogenesis protein
MNKQVQQIIFSHLSAAIDIGYRDGYTNIAKTLKKKKFGAFKPRYDLNDKAAIEAFKKEAFIVSGVGSYELEEKLKELAIEVIQNKGLSYKEFEPLARKLMLDYGIGLEDQAPGGWIKTNLYTAANSSQKAAEWNRLQDPDVQGVYPAYRYKTQEDDVVRPEHEKLDNLVLAADDPLWQTIWPPNDWNCRCYVEPLDQEEAAGEGVMDPTDEQRSGYTGDVAEDFRGNPGSDRSIWGKWLEQSYSDLPAGVRQDIIKGIKNIK